MKFRLVEDWDKKYDPPYNAEQIKANYGEDLYNKLIQDPVHKWRVETGIEIIHKEPTKKELDRIWNNWQLMTPEQKSLSDEKSLELFGLSNKENYNNLISLYEDWDRLEEERLDEKYWAAFNVPSIDKPFYLYVNNNNRKKNYSEAKDVLKNALGLAFTDNHNKQSYNKEAIAQLKNVLKSKAEVNSLKFKEVENPYLTHDIDISYIVTASDRDLRRKAEEDVENTLDYIEKQGIKDIPKCKFLTHHGDKQEGNNEHANKTLVGYGENRNKAANAVHMYIHSRLKGEEIQAGDESFVIYKIDNDGEVHQYICTIDIKEI